MFSQKNGTSLNRLKTLWAEGKTALGAIATIPCVQTVQIMARSGLDFIIIDMEHGAVDAGTAHNMIVATSGTPMIPLARVASTSAWHAKVPLDFGALGIAFPMTTTREAAAAAQPLSAILRVVSAFGDRSTVRRDGAYRCASIRIELMMRCWPLVPLSI